MKGKSIIQKICPKCNIVREGKGVGLLHNPQDGPRHKQKQG